MGQGTTPGRKSILVLLAAGYLVFRQPLVKRVGTAPQYPILRVGSTGDSVSVLQRALNLWGSFVSQQNGTPGTPPTLAVDGLYGPLTEAVVLAFQIDYNRTLNRLQPPIAQDGIAGPETIQALDAFLRFAGLGRLTATPLAKLRLSGG